MLAHVRKAKGSREEGFTLIELLVVIIIIGILAAIAIPVFLNQRTKGYDAQAKADAHNLGTLEETYQVDNSTYAGANGATGEDRVGTGFPVLQGVLTDYKASANVTNIKITYVTAAGLTGGTATTGFCVQTTATGGDTFAYNNQLGGLQPGKTALCP
jgi:type IV pilus assembly protein PilA